MVAIVDLCTQEVGMVAGEFATVQNQASVPVRQAATDLHFERLTSEGEGRR